MRTMRLFFDEISRNFHIIYTEKKLEMDFISLDIIKITLEVLKLKNYIGENETFWKYKKNMFGFL